MCVSSRTGSLWDTVTAQCSSIELYEVKQMVGESLIEQVCELHTEVISLREILGEGTSYRPVHMSTAHKLTQSINELVRHTSNKASQATEAIKEIRKALHLESTQLTSEITTLQQQLEQRASSVKAVTTHKEQASPPCSHSRLNSAQRFRQMVTDARTDCDHNYCNHS